MKLKMLAVFALAAGLLMVAGPAFAHHGTAAYNTTKSVTVTGKVTTFQFVNPHVIVAMDVTDNGQVHHWQGELTSPNHLARLGWNRETIKPGDTLTLSGFPAKSGADSMWIRKVTCNGQDLRLNGNDD